MRVVGGLLWLIHIISTFNDILPFVNGGDWLLS